MSYSFLIAYRGETHQIFELKSRDMTNFDTEQLVGTHRILIADLLECDFNLLSDNQLRGLIETHGFNKVLFIIGQYYSIEEFLGINSKDIEIKRTKHSIEQTIHTLLFGVAKTINGKYYIIFRNWERTLLYPGQLKNIGVI